MSTQITFKKFTTWLFINYKVINVITGKSASPKDFDILDFVEPRRRRYQSLLEYIHMKIEFYFQFIHDYDFTVWKDVKLMDENEVVSHFQYVMYKYIKEKLPSSFNGMFVLFVEPNRTQSFKLEFMRNKYLKHFQKHFLREFGIVFQ